jgi:hypothetical protein
MEEMVSQQPFEFAEAIFYGSIFAIGAATGIVRAGRDHEYRNCWHLCNIGLTSGAFTFAVLGTMYRWVGSPGTDEWSFLAMASLLGLIGKEQDKLIRGVIRFAFDKFGIRDLDVDEGQDE